MLTKTLSPALQYRRISDAIARTLPNGQGAGVEIILDIFWIFVRQSAGHEEFRRRKDLGKWILKQPMDQEALLEHAIELLPLVGQGLPRLVKFTNLATPGTAAEGKPPQIVAYCAEPDKDRLGERLRPLWGEKMYWKTNRQTFDEMASRRS